MSVAGQAADGRYLCKRDYWPTSILVPVRPIGASIPYPSRQTVYFEDGDRLRPFLLWTLPEREAWPVLEGVPSFFGAWLRYGVRMTLRHYAPEWDVTEDESEIVFTGFGFSGSGTIIRTDAAGMAYVANGNNLVEIDLAAGTSATTDLGAELAALSVGETSGRVYSAVLDFVSGTIGGEGYEDGYEAATDEASGAVAQGLSDCTSLIEYRASEMATTWAEANVPTGTEEYQADWIAGAIVGYTERYNAGWESGDCTVP